MTRCTNASGNLGSCAASCKNPLSSSRHRRLARQPGGRGRFSRQRRARCSLSLAMRTMPYPALGLMRPRLVPSKMCRGPVVAKAQTRAVWNRAPRV